MTPFAHTGMIRYPFPHATWDGLWDDELLQRIHNEFPSDGWKSYQNPNEYKLEHNTPGPAASELFDILRSSTAALSVLTDIPDLSMELIGGGYHLIPPGGRLAVHTDFNRSPATGLFRRLNCLVYLNHDWDDEGGCLELWNGEFSECVTIAPEWNRTVLFETSDHSWHGHPVPASRWRHSVAAYFYSPEPPPGYRGDHSTVWMP